LHLAIDPAGLLQMTMLEWQRAIATLQGFDHCEQARQQCLKVPRFELRFTMQTQ
jgi:hypothetical protein